MIDIEKAKKEFDRYVNNYDMSQYRIESKYKHSYRVMEICGEIATRLGLSEEEIELAKLIGLLHDIGRFDQWAQYGSYNDFKSFSHGEKGAEILKDNDYIRWYIEDDSYDDIILYAVRKHGIFVIDDEVADEKSLLFLKIVRDADKIDIFYEANEIFWPNESDVEAINNSYVSKDYYLQIMKCKPVKSKENESALDPIVRFLGFIFDFNFKASKDIIIENDYLNKLYGRFKFKMDNTKMQMGNIKDLCDREIRK